MSISLNTPATESLSHLEKIKKSIDTEHHSVAGPCCFKLSDKAMRDITQASFSQTVKFHYFLLISWSLLAQV